MPLNAIVKTQVSKKLEEYEGRINHLYLDSVGQVTVGVGHWIANRAAVATLPLSNAKTGKLATLAEKQAEYDSVSKQTKGFKAAWYKQHTTLVMNDSDITTLRDKHITSFYAELTNIYKKSKGYPADFDKLPEAVQKALFDMIFNLGATKLVNVFKNFDAAVKAGDWKKAGQESNRPQISAARNLYVKQLFLSAAAKP